MPKSTKSTDILMQEALTAAQAEEKPDVSKIAREFGVNRRTLANRVKNRHRAHNAYTPVNKALEPYQEEALIHWIRHMKDSNMPITPLLVAAWANRALARAG
ncbi:hypothetical protein PMG11_10956 [Penicillium brasilianum]|uniref:HTH psq-type domain-containing protein n=1 Tax=Penicillium brasilianum TaxID=104259 RepID=A0A0F7U0N5_PENBI|nr:hypothetical protein PMG11_10956 [Penicillium brasilianum]